MCRTAALLVCLSLMLCAAGPVDFGRRVLQEALAARKPPAASQNVLSELSPDPPESFRIQPGRVSGGDLRGLMYGLLEAAQQIRTHGHLIATVARPALALRSLRVELSDEDIAQPWFRSEAFWREQFETLARARFNRLTLFFSGRHRAAFFEHVPLVSRVAAEYAMDLAIGLRLDELALFGEAIPEAAGPSALLAIKGALTSSPAVRVVQFRAPEDGGHEYAAFCEEWLFRAVRESGRRVTLELSGPAIAPELLAAARQSGVPFRIGELYRAAPPKPPAGVRDGDVFWVVDHSATAPGRNVHSTAEIRRLVQECLKAGCAGFEVAGPAPAKAPELRPFTPWARLGYDPKTTDATLKREVIGS